MSDILTREVVGRLVGGIAHDFNNLLTPIVAYAELMAGTLPADSQPRAYVGEIQNAAMRAANLTRQLLAFSRRNTAQPSNLDLNDVVVDMREWLRRLVREDIELVLLPASDPSLVRVDRGQIEQVVMNLVVNAQDAMRDGGKLIIELSNLTFEAGHAPDELECDCVLLEISDTGTGMAPDVVAQVFEPFFTTKDTGKGTGLGLSTSSDIVAKHGGRIDVESELGKGTAFKIYLPRVEQMASPARERDGPDQLPTGSETLLLVDDEPLVRKAASSVLRRQGYTILEADSGYDALRVAQQYGCEGIQLLLTDVIMPLMGGQQLAKQLLEVAPATRVLYFSGYTDEATVHDGVLGPAEQFIEKPFTPAALAIRVRNVLDA